MKQVSVGEVQHNFSRILRDVDAGEEIPVVRRKQVVARIIPDCDTRNQTIRRSSRVLRPYLVR